MGYRILGCDPGKTNYAVSVVDYNFKPFKAEVVMTMMFEHTVDDLKGLEINQLVRKYDKEMRKIIRHYSVESICVERFQTRGNGGPLIEMVSLMIGRLFGVPKVQEVLCITASQWKNNFQKRNSLDEMYQLSPTPHQLDASLIGLYGAGMINGEDPYQRFNSKRWISQIQKTNLSPKLPKQRRKK